MQTLVFYPFIPHQSRICSLVRTHAMSKFMDTWKCNFILYFHAPIFLPLRFFTSISFHWTMDIFFKLLGHLRNAFEPLTEHNVQCTSSSLISMFKERWNFCLNFHGCFLANASLSPANQVFSINDCMEFQKANGKKEVNRIDGARQHTLYISYSTKNENCTQESKFWDKYFIHTLFYAFSLELLRYVACFASDNSMRSNLKLFRFSQQAELFMWKIRIKHFSILNTT